MATSNAILRDIAVSQELASDAELKAFSNEQRLPPQKWRVIPHQSLPSIEAQRLAMRLNALGSSFYFAKVVLRKHRLNDTLHRSMCENIEKTSIKDVIEIPRDHFKSTIYSEMAPMWWALPFGNTERMAMEKLGYSSEYLSWMERAHNQNTRSLLVSEVIDNAIKLGSRIAHHYENNDLFRDLFPEILPDTSCVWTAKSLQHKRTKDSPNGEGTYDFLGVGGALQSRHYDRAVQDDLVGRSAIDSDAVMEDTINYHRLLLGAFDSIPGKPTEENDELVVGNRWSFKDLNQWIRENETWFHFTTHSATGGCCPVHPVGKCIFPEEWSVEKLQRVQVREGARYYSCQYLNEPISDQEREFRPEWLRFYDVQAVSETDKRAMIIHEVYSGEVIKNVLPGELSITMVVDPNHAGNNGRCRHAITVTGVQHFSKNTPQRVYLLDCWAQSCDYHTFVAQIYKMATRWRLSEFWLETVMAQRYLKMYLDYRNKVENIKLKVRELKPDNSANAKDNRIRALNTIFAEGQFWCRRVAHADFQLEYEKFPVGKTKDILDTLAYAPQTWKYNASYREVLDFLHNNRQNMTRTVNSITGY